MAAFSWFLIPLSTHGSEECLSLRSSTVVEEPPPPPLSTSSAHLISPCRETLLKTHEVSLQLLLRGDLLLFPSSSLSLRSFLYAVPSSVVESHDPSFVLVWWMCSALLTDCWDGPRSEPIIYHGWTLTSKLDFKEVLIDAVRPYAFYSSEYPLILSIENHCSKKQQEKMAEHLTAILGDMLYVQEVDRTRTHLPSPNELKRKILIKAKKIQSPNSMNQQHFECPEQHVQTLPSILYSNPLHQHYSKRKHSDSVGSVDTVSKRFSDLVNYMESTKFRGFEVPRRYWEMSSFEESKAVQVAASSPEKFVNYNRRNLSRIYPRGTRLFSSNFDPLPLWLVGCQMVALNYQAKDRRLMFNRAMFRQNGRCGYILKPSSLLGKPVVLACQIRY